MLYLYSHDTHLRGGVGVDMINLYIRTEDMLS